MTQLIAGSFLLSLIPAAIPSHWLPLVFSGRSEGGDKKETLLTAGIAGFARTLSTVGLGVVIGLIGVDIAISAIFLIVTVSAIMSLVALGSRSLEKVNWHLLEHHEKITGFSLILLGIIHFSLIKPLTMILWL